MGLGGMTQGLSMPGLELSTSPMASWAPDLKMPAMPTMPSNIIPGRARLIPSRLTQCSVRHDGMQKSVLTVCGTADMHVCLFALLRGEGLPNGVPGIGSPQPRNGVVDEEATAKLEAEREALNSRLVSRMQPACPWHPAALDHERPAEVTAQAGLPVKG